MPAQYRREALPPRTCPGCGIVYQPSRVTHNYCTKACGKRAKYVPSGPYQGRPAIERCWEHIDQSAGLDACWPCTGATKPAGYGVISVRADDGGWTQTTMTRVILEWAEGRPLSVDEVAAHRCDNPSCCNPRHIFRATQSENLEDMRHKGRRERTGPAGGQLDEDAVREIRRLYATGAYSQQALADAYGVHQTGISNVVRRKGWAHIE